MKNAFVPWTIDEAMDLPLAIIEDTEDGTGVLELGRRTDAKLARAAQVVREHNSHEKLYDFTLGITELLSEFYRHDDWDLNDLAADLKTMIASGRVALAAADKKI